MFGFTDESKKIPNSKRLKDEIFPFFGKILFLTKMKRENQREFRKTAYIN